MEVLKKRKFGKYILRPKALETLAHHNADTMGEIGTSYLFLSKDILPEANFVVMGRQMKEISGAVQSYVEPHVHDVNSIYVYLGKLKAEVILEDERYEVKSPAAVFIPKGIRHSERVLEGSGVFMLIVEKSEYP